MSIQPVVKVRLGSGPCVLVNGLTVVEKDEKWDSSYTVLAWCEWVGIRVDLCDCDVSLLGDGMQDRRDHFTWAAPWCPKVYQYPF